MTMPHQHLLTLATRGRGMTDITARVETENALRRAKLEADAALPVVVTVANHGRVRLKRLRGPVRQLYLHANQLA